MMIDDLMDFYNKLFYHMVNNGKKYVTLSYMPMAPMINSIVQEYGIQGEHGLIGFAKHSKYLKSNYPIQITDEMMEVFIHDYKMYLVSEPLLLRYGHYISREEERITIDGTISLYDNYHTISDFIYGAHKFVGRSNP